MSRFAGRFHEMRESFFRVGYKLYFQLFLGTKKPAEAGPVILGLVSGVEDCNVSIRYLGSD